jgi:hypothetical protein
MERFYIVDFIDVFTLDFIMFSWAIINLMLDFSMCILKSIMPTSDHQFFIHLKHGPQVDDVINELENLVVFFFTPLLDSNWILLDYLLSHSTFPTLHCILACLHLSY